MLFNSKKIALKFLFSDYIANTTTEPFNWIWNEKMFGSYTIKTIAYGEGKTLSEEIDAFIMNFGLFSSNGEDDETIRSKNRQI